MAVLIKARSFFSPEAMLYKIEPETSVILITIYVLLLERRLRGDKA